MELGKHDENLITLMSDRGEMVFVTEGTSEGQMVFSCRQIDKG
jgi:hypothetical protein